MNCRFNILSLSALAPGLSSEDEWQSWAKVGGSVDLSAPINTPHMIPMMVARRLSQSCRLTTECVLPLLREQSCDSLVYVSRHAELTRGELLLESLARAEELSPTNFMMSIHNAALGSLVVQNHLKIPTVSIAACAESLHSGVIEAYSRLLDGVRRILLCDFEAKLPARLGSKFPANIANIPYVVAMILERGNQWSFDCSFGHSSDEPRESIAIQFMRFYYQGVEKFTTHGMKSCAVWERNSAV